MKHLADMETSRRLCWSWQDGLPSGLKDSTQRKCWSLRLCSKTGRVNTRLSQKSGKFSRLNWGDKQLLNLRSVKKQGILSVCALVHFVPCPISGIQSDRISAKKLPVNPTERKKNASHMQDFQACPGRECVTPIPFLARADHSPILGQEGKELQSYYVLRRKSRKMFWTALMMFTAVNTAFEPTPDSRLRDAKLQRALPNFQ